eukprot:TRINITY_DN29937_c0_g1_i1.p1 TRINITY_DN29937_c0_g1~~TRINITY_DN29937_c0_g1_i1.p1  ORF type:complete len:129 (+),score=48.34 TRINITY_DN29937_c0_g1_i1:10-396(+)
MAILSVLLFCWFLVFFFFQAEDGIRDLVRSRGLGDVYKRQGTNKVASPDRDPDELTNWDTISARTEAGGGATNTTGTTAAPNNTITTTQDSSPTPLQQEKRAVTSQIVIREGRAVSYTHLTLPTIYSV